MPTTQPTNQPRPLPFRLGALIWNQYTDWPAFRDIGARTKSPGYDQLRNRGMTRPILHGSPNEQADRIRSYQAVGFSNVLYHLAAPYDEETLERFVGEVKPQVAGARSRD